MKNTLKRKVINKGNPKKRSIINKKKTLTGIRTKTLQKNQNTKNISNPVISIYSLLPLNFVPPNLSHISHINKPLNTTKIPLGKSLTSPTNLRYLNPLNNLVDNPINKTSIIAKVPRKYVKTGKRVEPVKPINMSYLSSKSEKRINAHNILKTRIQKSIFKPRHTLVSHGRVYNVCKTCPSYLRKRLKVLK